MIETTTGKVKTRKTDLSSLLKAIEKATDSAFDETLRVYRGLSIFDMEGRCISAVLEEQLRAICRSWNLYARTAVDFEELRIARSMDEIFGGTWY